MSTQASATVDVGSVRFGNRLPLALIAGPCAMESRDHALETAAALKEIAGRVGIGLVYKSSFDKANRTSAGSVRGVGLDRALDDADARRGQLDEDAPAIGGIGGSAHKPGSLETIDAVRDGRGRDEERPRESGRAHPVRSAGPAEDAEDVVLVRVEIELVEDVLRGALDVPRGAADALDDRLRRDVHAGTLALPLREREVDVILLSGNTKTLTRR